MQDVPLLSAGSSVSWEGIPQGGLQITTDPSGTGGGVRPWRLPYADLDLFVPTKGTAHHESSSNSILTQAANSSGVRIVLSTNTDKLRMVVRPRFVYSPTEFDLVVDGELLASRSFGAEKSIDLPDGVEPGTPAWARTCPS